MFLYLDSTAFATTDTARYHLSADSRKSVQEAQYLLNSFFDMILTFGLLHQSDSSG
jgi:hypothetical protein